MLDFVIFSHNNGLKLQNIIKKSVFVSENALYIKYTNNTKNTEKIHRLLALILCGF